jgi:hypothetical protein
MAKPEVIVTQDSPSDWDEVEIPSLPWWTPDPLRVAHALTCLVASQEVTETRFGERIYYKCEVVSDSKDDNREYAPGDTVMVGESACLAVLGKLVGRVVRITPDGMRGRAKWYIVEARKR